MSLISKILMLSRSPQGRRLTEKAARYASSPEGKRRIAEARQRVTARGAKRGRVSR